MPQACLHTKISNPKFPTAALDAFIDVSGSFTVAAKMGEQRCSLWTPAGEFTVLFPVSTVFLAVTRARIEGRLVELLEAEKPEENVEGKQVEQQSSKE